MDTSEVSDLAINSATQSVEQLTVQSAMNRFDEIDIICKDKFHVTRKCAVPDCVNTQNRCRITISHDKPHNSYFFTVGHNRISLVLSKLNAAVKPLAVNIADIIGSAVSGKIGTHESLIIISKDLPVADDAPAIVLTTHIHIMYGIVTYIAHAFAFTKCVTNAEMGNASIFGIAYMLEHNIDARHNYSYAINPRCGENADVLMMHVVAKLPQALPITVSEISGSLTPAHVAAVMCEDLQMLFPASFEISYDLMCKAYQGFAHANGIIDPVGALVFGLTNTSPYGAGNAIIGKLLARVLPKVVDCKDHKGHDK